MYKNRRDTDTYQGLVGCIGSLFTVLVCVPIILIWLVVEPITAIICLSIVAMIIVAYNKGKDDDA